MKNLELQETVYFRNQKVNFIYFETLFTSEKIDGTFEDRISVQIEGAILNVAAIELYN